MISTIFSLTQILLYTVSIPQILPPNNPYPAIICVDANQYWDGPYTIEISPVNGRGQILASVYEQSDEGRFLVSQVTVEKQANEKQILFLGDNFKFEMGMDTFNPKEPNTATITFKYDQSIVTAPYACLFF